jgi:ubiquinone/menaquinone biosynthesis C-methylase UbiE
MQTSAVTETVRSPAEVYEAQFVPALFQPWAELVADLAQLAPGQRVLDVACGTGVLACAAAARVGSAGEVTGIDPSEDMLGVARRKPARVTWTQARAESLPFPDASFDRVVSQFGLMLFEDRRAALGEMRRVLRPAGRLVVAVCDALDHAPGYAVLAELLQRLFGARVADAFRAPFVLGDRAQLRALCSEAGLTDARVSRHEGTVAFASIAALVGAERACVWTLGGLLDTPQFERLRVEAEESLRPFQTEDGRVAFGMPALVVSATK